MCVCVCVCVSVLVYAVDISGTEWNNKKAFKLQILFLLSSVEFAINKC